MSAPSLSAAARRAPERAVLFYAAAGDLVADLIRVNGFEPARVAAWTSPSASRCSAICTNTAAWVGS